MSWPKLKRPPIREAVFDLRYLPATQPRIERIREFCDQFRGDFPQINEMVVFDVRADISHEEKKNFHSQRILNGYRLSNQKRSFVLQLRSDGFTFSKITPYVSWEEIRTEVSPILERFFDFFSEVHITRIALRYINFFTLKLEQSANAYFKILPSYPSNLSKHVDGFKVQLFLPNREQGLKSVIAFSVEPTKTVKTFSTTFDIDIFKEHIYDKENIKDMLEDFEKIRDYKNLIFFSCLTPELISNFN